MVGLARKKSLNSVGSRFGFLLSRREQSFTFAINVRYSADYWRRVNSKIEAVIRQSLPVFFIVIFLFTLRGAWQGTLSNNPWETGDWLINYQGGFVRRGLLGEVLFQLHLFTGIKATVYVFAVQAFCYFSFFILCFLLLRRQNSILVYVPLVVSPFLFEFQFYGGGYRKEVLYFFVIAYVAWCHNRCPPMRFERHYYTVLLCFPLLILSHEMLIVFLPYLLMIYFSKFGLTARRAYLHLVFLSFSLLAFIATLVWHGDGATVTSICQSLGVSAPSACEQRGAIAWLQYSATDGGRFVFRKISNSDYLSGYALYLGLAILAFVPVSRRLQRFIHNPLLLILFLICIAGTAMLSAVAIDWGRFIYINLVSLFVLSLLSSSADIQLEHRRLADSAASSVFRSYVFAGKYNAVILLTIAVVLLFYAISWHLPHAFR